MRVHLVVRAALGAATLALTACGNGSSPAAGDATVLHRGNKSEPLTLDPHIAHVQDTRFIIAEMFTGLYEPGPGGEPVPSLAERVSVSADGLVWTFTLREAVWSDGVPITADDVVAGLRRALDPATLNPYPTALLMLENAEAVNQGRMPVEALGASARDASTVELRLAYPAPYLPSVLMLWGQPLPRHAYEAHGRNWLDSDKIVTSGPFHLVEWRSDNFVHLRASETFHAADQVCLEEVYYYPTVDTAAAERRVRNGELHMNTEFAGANLDFLRRRNPDLVSLTPGVLLRNITFNTSEPPFDDARVRRALSLALDREFLTAEMLAGADAPALRVVGPGIENRLEGIALDFAGTDLAARRAEALALLEAAGYGPDNPLTFTLFYTPSAGWPRLVPVMQADWTSIAPWVEIDLQVRETQLHYAGMRAGAFQAGTAGWLPDINDPHGYLMQWDSAAGEINYTRWTDARFDALLHEGVQTADPQQRARLMGEAERIVLDAAPIIPVFFESTKLLVSERVEGFVPNPFRLHQSRWLCLQDTPD